MDETKFLDLSKLTDPEIAAIRKGFYKFMYSGKHCFFGGVDKDDLKTLNKAFGYSNKKTLIIGILIGLGCPFVSRKIKSIWNTMNPTSLNKLKTFLSIHSSSKELYEDYEED